MSRNRQSVKKTAQRLLFGIIGIVIIITGVFLWWRHSEIIRLQTASQLLETPRGLIEYATFGDGPAVLVLHGTIGGYDQAQTLAEMLDTDAYRFISVSRPGYLRTSLETGATFAGQADAYAAFLDELGIEQVAIMAISGGGPPTLQFALRYPERTWGLVMIATNSDVSAGKENQTTAVDEKASPPPKWLLDLIFSDFASWIVTTGAKWQPKWFLPLLVGENYTNAVLNDPTKYQLYRGFVNSFSMTSQRRVGSFNEGQNFLQHTGYPFEEILTPMLILHGTEDSETIGIQQHYLRETVPNADYIDIEGGTHFMPVSHNDVIAPLIRDFLQEHKP